MKKILEYNLNLNSIADSLPQMPALHDYQVDEIKIENNTLNISSVDFCHDYDYSDWVGFPPKKVLVEFIFEGEVDCNVTVSKYFPKKQIREKNKFGSGKRSNCYDIQEFIKIYKDYNLEILYNHVSFNWVIVDFAARRKNLIQEAQMQMYCGQVRYTFTD